MAANSNETSARTLKMSKPAARLKKTTSPRDPASWPEQVVQAIRRAEAFYSKGMYEKAEAYYLHALAGAEQAFGPDHLKVAMVLNNLGVIYKCLARFAEARRVYERSLAIMEPVLGPEDCDVAVLYHNLGGLEHASGNYARGEPFARKSVEMSGRSLERYRWAKRCNWAWTNGINLSKAFSSPSLLQAISNLVGSCSWNGTKNSQNLP